MYKIWDRKSLLRLLQLHDMKGWGGILLEDIQKSLKHSEKILRALQKDNEIFYVQRPVDKKKIVFYNDRTAVFHLDDQIQNLWRSIVVSSTNDANIEEYLRKQEARSKQDESVRKPLGPVKRRKSAPRKKLSKKLYTEHPPNVANT